MAFKKKLKDNWESDQAKPQNLPYESHHVAGEPPKIDSQDFELEDDWDFTKSALDIRRIVKSLPEHKKKSLSIEAKTQQGRDEKQKRMMKEEIKNALVGHGIIQPSMVPKLEHLSLEDYEELLLSPDSKDLISEQDPSEKKHTPILIDETRKDIEATAWDSEQDNLMKGLMKSDKGMHDEDYYPTVKDERDNKLEDLISHPDRAQLSIFKSHASEMPVSLKDKANAGIFYFLKSFRG
jgi:hypothetical protein